MFKFSVMRQKSLLLSFFVLLIISTLLLLTAEFKTIGAAHLFGITNESLSSFTAILTLVFITTLITILFSFKFLNNAQFKPSSDNETKIGLSFIQESLEENKNKAQIIKDLERKGIKKKQIEAYLKEREEKAKE